MPTYLQNNDHAPRPDRPVHVPLQEHPRVGNRRLFSQISSTCINFQPTAFRRLVSIDDTVAAELPTFVTKKKIDMLQVTRFVNNVDALYAHVLFRTRQPLDIHGYVPQWLVSVVLEKNWNELVLSTQSHEFINMISHFLLNFAVNRDHVCSVIFQVEILSSFALHNTLCAPLSLPFKDRSKLFSS